MSELQIAVQKVSGRVANNDGEFFNEYEALELKWKEPGFTYCWIDSDSRVLPIRRRMGWQLCHPRTDFMEKGCPESDIPGEWSVASGEIRFGDCMLAKMPIELWSQRDQARKKRRDDKRRANIEAPLSVGEQVTRSLPSKYGDKVGGNIVTLG